MKTRPIKSYFRRFARARKGVATLEFALVLPILTLLLVGGVELLTFAWAQGRVQDASSSVGDLVTRNVAIDESSIGVIFNAAEAIMETNKRGDASTTPVDITVTAAVACKCDPNDADSALCFEALWSHRFNGAGVENGVAIGDELEGVPISLANFEGDSVIVTETIYTYQPVLKMVLSGDAIELSDTSYFRPRLSERVDHIGGQKQAGTQICNGAVTL